MIFFDIYITTRTEFIGSPYTSHRKSLMSHGGLTALVLWKFILGSKAHLDDKRPLSVLSKHSRLYESRVSG